MRQKFSETGSNHSPFHQSYLRTLRAIVACENNWANAYINKTRHELSTPDKCDEMIKIQKEVAPVLNRLHGDLHYEGPNSPWIKDRKLVTMVGRHLSQLGTDKDMANYEVFVEKTAAAFKAPYDIKIDSTPALRA